jgi:hypothetical protein
VWLISRYPRPSYALASLLDRVKPCTAWTRRDRAVMIGLRYGSHPWPYPRVAAAPDPDSLNPPIVIAGLHLGAMTAIGALLHSLPGEVLSLVGGVAESRPGVTLVVVGEEESQRAAQMKRAVDAVRAGQTVFVAADAASGAPEVEVLGHTVSFARGPFAIARLTGAPVVPVMARWRGRKIEIEAGERIEPADEVTMVGHFGAWLSEYLTRYPELEPGLDHPRFG